MSKDTEIMATESTNADFSALHPANLLQRIIDEGATQTCFEHVYRISEDGACNRDAFICSALEPRLRDSLDANIAFAKEHPDDYDVGDWSTSCWNTEEKAREIMALKESHGHFPALLIGTILPESGYSILSTERRSIKTLNASKRRKKRGHIDWWIFDTQDVSPQFKFATPIEGQCEEEKVI